MPCYDGGPDPSTRAHWEPILRHNSPTAEAFCALCQWLEVNNFRVMIEDVPAAWKWWQEHKARDAAKAKAELDKMKKEKDRKELLERLTPYEKSLLGHK